MKARRPAGKDPRGRELGTTAALVGKQPVVVVTAVVVAPASAARTVARAWRRTLARRWSGIPRRQSRGSARVPSSRTREVVFARGSSRLHLLFSGVTESSFVSYKMFNGTITPQAARSWPGQDVSREMVRLRDRERDLAGGRGPGPGARARAHGAPRRIFFSDLLHTCV